MKHEQCSKANRRAPRRTRECLSPHAPAGEAAGPFLLRLPPAAGGGGTPDLRLGSLNRAPRVRVAGAADVMGVATAWRIKALRLRPHLGGVEQCGGVDPRRPFRLGARWCSRHGRRGGSGDRVVDFVSSGFGFVTVVVVPVSSRGQGGLYSFGLFCGLRLEALVFWSSRVVAVLHRAAGAGCGLPLALVVCSFRFLLQLAGAPLAEGSLPSRGAWPQPMVVQRSDPISWRWTWLSQ